MPINAAPKYTNPFTANFTGVGSVDEYLRLSWIYPLGVPGEKLFKVGVQCFLEDVTSITSVPDEHLIASLSMAAILAGEILPGTVEYVAAVTQQDTKNFQTIVGEVRLKPQTVSFLNPQPVDDLNYGPAGTVYDITFQKGTGTNTKVVRTDAWSISQYGNRIDDIYSMVYCACGALHKQFGFKKSDLGAAGSTNRNSVIDFIATQKFWI